MQRYEHSIRYAYVFRALNNTLLLRALYGTRLTLSTRMYRLFYRAMLRRVRLCHRMSHVRLSVTFRYIFHTGWNSSKITSRLIKVSAQADSNKKGRHRRSDPTGTPTKLGRNTCGVISTKTFNISETVQYRTKVIMTD